MPETNQKLDQQKASASSAASNRLKKSKDRLIQDLKENGQGTITIDWLCRSIESNIPKEHGSMSKKEKEGLTDIQRIAIAQKNLVKEFAQIRKLAPRTKVVINKGLLPLVESIKV